MDIINFLKKKINIKEFDLNERENFYLWIKKTDSIIYKFSNNFEYILQSTRNFHGKIERENGIVYLTKRSNNHSNILVIVNYFGDISSIIKDIIDTVKNRKYKVIIKNISENQEIFLKKYGFRDYAKDESWIKFETNNFWRKNRRVIENFKTNNFIDSDFRYDDNTYPEYIYDLNKILTLEGKKFRSMRGELNRFNRELADNIEMLEYNPSIHKDSLLLLLDNWSKMMELNDAEEKIEAKRAHEFCLNDLLIDNLRLIFIDKQKNKIIGFSYLSIIQDFLAYNGLFQDSSYRDIKKWLIIESLKYASTKFKITSIGFQGSETHSLDILKRRFAPLCSFRYKHLILVNKKEKID